VGSLNPEEADESFSGWKAYTLSEVENLPRVAVIHPEAHMSQESLARRHKEEAKADKTFARKALADATQRTTTYQRLSEVLHANYKEKIGHEAAEDHRANLQLAADNQAALRKLHEDQKLDSALANAALEFKNSEVQAEATRRAAYLTAQHDREQAERLAVQAWTEAREVARGQQMHAYQEAEGEYDAAVAYANSPDNSVSVRDELIAEAAESEKTSKQAADKALKEIYDGVDQQLATAKDTAKRVMDNTNELSDQQMQASISESGRYMDEVQNNVKKERLDANQLLADKKAVDSRGVLLGPVGIKQDAAEEKARAYSRISLPGYTYGKDEAAPENESL
jgi:hypothetical protein